MEFKLTNNQQLVEEEQKGGGGMKEGGSGRERGGRGEGRETERDGSIAGPYFFFIGRYSSSVGNSSACRRMQGMQVTEYNE